MEITRKQVFTNVIWRFLERIGAQVVSFIVSIIIARLVMPEAYGMIALITVFISIFQVFVDSGLGNALVQKKDADDTDFSTVFYTNLFFCFVLYILVFFLAKPIAVFYKNLELVPVIRVVGLSLIISGVKNIQQAYVSKNLLFKKFFFSTIIGTIIAACIGIFMAYKGFGIWALVALQITNMTIDTLIVWLTVKWRPKLLFSFSRLKGLFSFGWKLLVTDLINTTYIRIRELLIGKIYTPADLAYYDKGNSLSLLVVSNVDTSISSVIMPTIANYQDDTARVKAIARKTIKISTFVLSPCLLGVAAVAPNLIDVLLTSKWLSCVAYLQIFCFGYLFFPIYTANLNVMRSLGRSDLFLKVEIVKKTIGAVLLLSAVKFGVFWIAVSFLIERIVEVFVDIWPNRKLINYKIHEQLRDVLPNYLCSFLMFVIVYLSNYIEYSFSKVLFLILQIMVGAILYISFCFISRNESFTYFLNIIRSKVTGKANE